MSKTPVLITLNEYNESADTYVFEIHHDKKSMKVTVAYLSDRTKIEAIGEINDAGFLDNTHIVSAMFNALLDAMQDNETYADIFARNEYVVLAM